jgi:S-adenosylmethionine hydrolase
VVKKPVITLTTDFGLKDPFAGLMKGVIYGINPDVQVIDITHGISRHDTSQAAEVIRMSYRYFPPFSAHVVVVDPGVGGSRRPIMVIVKSHCFIGPDNGVFSRIYEKIEPDFLRVLHLTAEHYFRKREGPTFDGRDIYAPVAAWYSRGIESDRFGDEIADYVRIPGSPLTIEGGKVMKGAVVTVDHFGNAITNIDRERLEEGLPGISERGMKVTYRGMPVPVARFYEDTTGSAGKLSSIMNSFGLLELFVTRGSAAKEFGITVGEEVTVSQDE